MKKTLLALAITALSANAFAVDVDFDPAAGQVQKNYIPNELTFNNTVTTADDLSWNLGTAVPVGESRFVRVNLNDGSLFGGTPTLTVGAVTGTVKAGGPNQGYAVFEVAVAAGGTALTAADKAVLGLSNLILTSKKDVTASYTAYANETLAVTQTSPLYSKAAAPYLQFVNGLIVDTKAPSVQKIIDVAATPTASKFLNGSTSETLGEGVRVQVVANAVSYVVGTAPTVTSLIGNASKLVVTGDFSAAKTAAGVLDPSKVTLNGTPASDLTATTATFSVTAALGTAPAAPAPATYAPLVYAVDGTTAIAPASYSAVLNIGDVAGSSAAKTSVTIGKVAELAKNGSTAFVDLALTPAGAYKNFVRITNKTNIAGNVHVKLFNDEGKSVEFPLSAVAGQEAALEAQASTAQLNINDIYAAAKATDATFAVAEGRNKLRLEVTGEFSNGTDDDGISVQSYTVSKDNNSFATF